MESAVFVPADHPLGNEDPLLLYPRSSTSLNKVSKENTFCMFLLFLFFVNEYAWLYYLSRKEGLIAGGCKEAWLESDLNGTNNN